MSKTIYTTKRTTVVTKNPAPKKADQAKPPVMPKRFAVAEIDYSGTDATVIVTSDIAGVALLLEIQTFLRQHT